MSTKIHAQKHQVDRLNPHLASSAETPSSSVCVYVCVCSCPAPLTLTLKLTPLIHNSTHGSHYTHMQGEGEREKRTSEERENLAQPKKISEAGKTVPSLRNLYCVTHFYLHFRLSADNSDFFPLKSQNI